MESGGESGVPARIPVSTRHDYPIRIQKAASTLDLKFVSVQWELACCECVCKGISFASDADVASSYNELGASPAAISPRHVTQCSKVP
jgi:hypothetical protein